jgi:hypothetical protein
MLIVYSAAQAWNRSDSRAAKALSLRGQSENNLMREAHREAARILYEERNQDSDGSIELYVDLHGMCSSSSAGTSVSLTLHQVSIRMNQYHIWRVSSSNTVHPHAQSTPSLEQDTTPKMAKTRLVKRSAVS